MLPEGTVPGYVIGKAPLDLNVTERALSDIQKLAQGAGAVIVYGSARMDGGAMRNSAIVVDSDGSVAGVADKTFLWHFDRQWFTAAAQSQPVQTSIGPLGVMICADGRIPTLARALVDAGAEMLVMPTAWVSSGRDAATLENVQADLLAQVRARENGVPFVAANKTGVERGCVLYCGKSQIVHASGEIVALAPERQAVTLSAHVQMGSPSPFRSAPKQIAAPQARSTPLRIAIGPQTDPIAAELQSILEADVFVGGDERGDGLFAGTAALAVAGDATVMDPGGLVPYKLAGYDLIVWRAASGDARWLRRIARARALELRLYILCIVAGEFAFAVDPDGAVVCGTFDAFAIASFSFLPERARQTLVAPSTDIIEGLERVRF